MPLQDFIPEGSDTGAQGGVGGYQDFVPTPAVAPTPEVEVVPEEPIVPETDDVTGEPITDAEPETSEDAVPPTTEPEKTEEVVVPVAGKPVERKISKSQAKRLGVVESE